MLQIIFLHQIKERRDTHLLFSFCPFLDGKMWQALVLAAATSGPLGAQAFTVPYTKVVENVGVVDTIAGGTAYLGGGDSVIAAPLAASPYVRIWYEVIDPTTNARAITTWNGLEFFNELATAPDRVHTVALVRPLSPYFHSFFPLLCSLPFLA